MFYDHGARHSAACIPHQVLKNSIFALSEADGPSRACDETVGTIDFQIVDPDLISKFLGPAQQSVDPGAQLLKGKGFGHEIISSRPQGHHTISNFVMRAHEQNPCRRAGLAQFTKHGHSI